MIYRTSDQKRDQSGSTPWWRRLGLGRSKSTPSTAASVKYSLKSVPIKGSQPKITVNGQAALEAPPEVRLRVLADLMSGDERAEDYASGVCYDVVAFILALDGRLSRSTVETTGGQAWLEYFDFDSCPTWTGQDIPEKSVVAFKRVGSYEPGYFHAAVAVGGTHVRGVNANGITYGWPDKADLTDRLKDRSDIEVRYLAP